MRRWLSSAQLVSLTTWLLWAKANWMYTSSSCYDLDTGPRHSLPARLLSASWTATWPSIWNQVTSEDGGTDVAAAAAVTIWLMLSSLILPMPHYNASNAWWHCYSDFWLLRYLFCPMQMCSITAITGPFCWMIMSHQGLIMYNIQKDTWLCIQDCKTSLESLHNYKNPIQSHPPIHTEWFISIGYGREEDWI